MKRLLTPNKTQVQIMKSLFLSDGLGFAQMNIDGLTNDHFAYHIRKLAGDGVIEKDQEGKYHLTTAGRTAALFLDSAKDKFISQGFVACRVVLKRVHEGEAQILFQRRTKVPFKGYLAEPGGKILWGENVIDSAKRNMLEQTGLVCDMEIEGQIHIKDLYDGEVVQDKYFFVLSAGVVSGELKDSGPTGANEWFTREELVKNPKTHQGVLKILDIADSESFEFAEEVHETNEY